MRIGRVVVILPVDLDRDEIVLIRQFRLGAHLALGQGDLVEVPAGRVERGEDVAAAARRECQEETGLAPQALVPLFDLMPSAGLVATSTCSSSWRWSMRRRCRSAPARRTSRRTRGRSACRSTARSKRSQAGTLHYGAAVIALQWLALNRARLREIVRRGRCDERDPASPSTGRRPANGSTPLRAACQGTRHSRSGRTRSAIAREIAYACVWNPPHGLLAGFPNLKAIINLGAGVDHLLADPALPPVPVARVAHDDLTQRVTEYVVLHVLMHHRRQRLYDAQQRERLWRAHDQPAAGEVAVGVMGLGVIGRNVADALARLGFKVAGWSRTAKNLAGVETFHGRAGLDAFLARTEILVCLLPRTPRHRRNSQPRACSASSSAMARPAARS